MKILYLSDGPSVHTRRWAEHFRDLGHEIHLASFRRVNIPGVRCYHLKTFYLGKLGFLLAIPELRRIARTVGPDVVHAQYVTSYGFLGAMSGLRPLVVTAWGTDVLLSPQQSRIRKWFASYALRHAEVVTTVAEHMNPAVIKLGARAEQVRTIPFGVDVEHFRPVDEARPAGAPLRLICTRNFAEVYDIPTLLAALCEDGVRELGLQVELLGDGPLRGQLESIVASRGLGSCVRFLGHVDHGRLAELLASSDLFVTPSLSDGNNISLNEAMACGCFPIASSIPANRQWLEPEVNGLLFSPGDSGQLAKCIIEGALNSGLRSKAAVINRAIVASRANWAVATRSMEEIYLSLAQHGVRNAPDQ